MREKRPGDWEVRLGQVAKLAELRESAVVHAHNGCGVLFVPFGHRRPRPTDRHFPGTDRRPLAGVGSRRSEGEA